MFLIFITLASLFIIDMNRIKNNEPVLFSTWGYSYAPAIDLHEEEIEVAIKNYLVEKSDNEPTHHGNKKTLLVLKYICLKRKKNLHILIYTLGF